MIFEGIGKAGATATFAALASNPTTAFLTQGVQGKILFAVLTWFYSLLASKGLVVLNIGVARIEVLIERKEFDGTFDDAVKLIAKGNLTDEDRAAIDNKVISAFRKFAAFGVRNG